MGIKATATMATRATKATATMATTATRATVTMAITVTKATATTAITATRATATMETRAMETRAEAGHQVCQMALAPASHLLALSATALAGLRGCAANSGMDSPTSATSLGCSCTQHWFFGAAIGALQPAVQMLAVCSAQHDMHLDLARFLGQLPSVINHSLLKPCTDPSELPSGTTTATHWSRQTLPLGVTSLPAATALAHDVLYLL
eukprot:1156599-Pelagomonas_calceolata.AAC.9